MIWLNTSLTWKITKVRVIPVFTVIKLQWSRCYWEFQCRGTGHSVKFDWFPVNFLWFPVEIQWISSGIPLNFPVAPGLLVTSDLSLVFAKSVGFPPLTGIAPQNGVLFLLLWSFTKIHFFLETSKILRSDRMSFNINLNGGHWIINEITLILAEGSCIY